MLNELDDISNPSLTLYKALAPRLDIKNVTTDLTTPGGHINTSKVDIK